MEQPGTTVKPTIDGRRTVDAVQERIGAPDAHCARVPSQLLWLDGDLAHSAWFEAGESKPAPGSVIRLRTDLVAGAWSTDEVEAANRAARTAGLFTHPELVETLYRGLADNSVGRVIETILKADLIVIDEVLETTPARGSA